MLLSITVNYEARDFFGQMVIRRDEINRPGPKDVERALHAAGKPDYYIHFNYMDGSSDCLWHEFNDDCWTMQHWESCYSKDEPVKTTARKAKKRIREAAGL